MARRQQAGERFDQLMEMLHEQYHAGDAEVESRDLITSLRKFAGGAGVGYDWDKVLDTRLDGAYALDQFSDMLAARPIPDGDYAYDVQLEQDPLAEGSAGRIFVCYRLRSLGSKATYLLLKQVVTAGDGRQTARLEGRLVADLGDRDWTDGKVVGLVGHLEATCRRAYFYRPALDDRGQVEPFGQVLSLRSFGEELSESADGRPSPAALDEALPKLLKALGAGAAVVDGRERGFDTKLVLGW